MKFRNTDYDRLYRRLYRMFDRAAPLKTDCGELCGGACCLGDDQTGMLLFPHEKTTLNTVASEGGVYAICNGVCNRSERPLSCRIFPLFPVIDERGAIALSADLRGYHVCPLVRNAEQVRFSKPFLRRVRKAGRLLMRDGDCRAFLADVSEELSGLRVMADLIGDDGGTEND